MEYRSTQHFTAETFDQMGVEMVRVSDYMGMVFAVLSPEQFETLYEPLPQPKD